MFSSETLARAETVLARCRVAGLKLAVAESCTGGLIGGSLTAIPGSSDTFLGGAVAYANTAKAAMLGVPETMLEAYGAVSEPVARAMAEGVLARTGAKLSVAVTGIAGPGGGTEEKPVGLVHFATARAGAPTLACHRIFAGDRAKVRAETVDAALDLLLAQLP